MRIAATVDGASDVVVPLAQGDQVLIFDSEAGTVERYENPALTADAHRRVVAVQFMLEQNSDAVCVVPGSFCPHSHLFANRNGLRFIGLRPGTPFGLVGEHAEEAIRGSLPQLPPAWLGMHGGHGGHQHQCCQHREQAVEDNG